MSLIEYIDLIQAYLQTMFTNQYNKKIKEDIDKTSHKNKCAANVCYKSICQLKKKHLVRELKNIQLTLKMIDKSVNVYNKSNNDGLHRP